MERTFFIATFCDLLLSLRNKGANYTLQEIDYVYTLLTEANDRFPGILHDEEVREATFATFGESVREESFSCKRVKRE